MSRSGKAKGRLGQNEIRDKLLETFPEFEQDDIKGCVMGDTGEESQDYKQHITTWNKRPPIIKGNQLCATDQIVNLG